jgi:nucleotide-binding universal stress UspA family protein
LSEPRQQKISKILVAVDGSEESMLAADCAIDMATKNNAELIALNVIHSQKYLYSPSYVWRPVIPSTITSIIKNQEEEAQRWL